MKQGTPSYKYARIIEQEAWRDAIRRQALGIAANDCQRKAILGFEHKGKPGMSQLGILRSLLKDIPPQPNPIHSARITEWVNHINEKRQEKWPAGNLDKVKKLLIQSDDIWDYLKLSESDITLTEGGEAKLKDSLWGEAVQTLVMSCIRAHKRDSESKDSKEA